MTFKESADALESIDGGSLSHDAAIEHKDDSDELPRTFVEVRLGTSEANPHCLSMYLTSYTFGVG